MSLTLVRKPEESTTGDSQAESPLWLWLKKRGPSIGLVVLLLSVIGYIQARNMNGWPEPFDDEGAYMSQAWAVVYEHRLSHYTYWWDHPPFGWLTIAFYAWSTDGFGRVDSAIAVGREVMLIANLVSSALIFVLARRLQFSRLTAAMAVVLFALSPLAMHYHRMVFLDNMAVAWLLAALVFAASPRRSLMASFASAACLAGAVLTKETTATLLPAVVWLLLQNTEKQTRRWSIAVFFASFAALTFAYPLYAILKNELIPGPGHTSLLWAVWWQLFERAPSGSLLDPDSGTRGLVQLWTDIDPWLLLTGVILVPVGLFIRRLRVVSIALALQVAMMFRGGYMPYPYIIAMLPFAALLIAGVADVLWKVRLGTAAKTRLIGPVAAAASIVLFAAFAAPKWVEGLDKQMSVDRSSAHQQATAWVVDNVPSDAVLLVDGSTWVDLTLKGLENQIWFYKADLDPEVRQELLKNGYRDVDYVVLGAQSPQALSELPTVRAAIEHSKVVKRFGEGEFEIIVRKVR